MIEIQQSALPCSEPELRQAVIDFAAALEAHKATTGEAAPWPLYEVVRVILADPDRDFVVVVSPGVPVRPPCPNPETMDFDEQAWAWVVNPTKLADWEQRQALALDPMRISLIDRLRTATPADIDAYVDQTVLDLPTARLMFRRILRALALLARQ